MPKKKQAPESNFEHPDYEKIASLDECERLLLEHKNILVRKDKTEFQIKASKKEANAAHNEQLKELSEEREHELGVIDMLNDRKKVLGAGGTVIPMPAKAAKA